MQVKKSLKWTCKACGEKQSFFRAYGEGSGADCRRHVQKLNLLQGQISELSLRSLEESVNAEEEENADPLQAVHASLQEKPQPSESRWLKYLESDSKDLGLEEGGTPSATTTETPDPPFSTGLPRKRRWGQSTVQPPSCPDVQDFRNCKVTSEPLKDHAGLAAKVKGSSPVDWDTRELIIPREPARPAQQVKATSSKWEQFLPPLGNSSSVDTEPPTPLQQGHRPALAAQAEQGTPRPQAPREGGLRGTPGALQPPQDSHSAMPEPKRLCGKTPRQPQGTGPWAEGGLLVRGAQEPSPMRLCDLFKTGEDFDDDL